MSEIQQMKQFVSLKKILGAAAFILGSALSLSAEALPSFPEPNLCRVVVDDIGDVGFQISNGQRIVEESSTLLRKRVGRAGVVYEGQLKAAEKMKRMLNGAENEITEMQMRYLRAAVKNASYRVRIRFGAQKGKSWIELTCRKAGASQKKKPLDQLKVRHASFSGAVAEMKRQMPGFCLEITGEMKGQSQNQGAEQNKRKWTPSSSRKKTTGKWTPPPRRN